MILFRSLSAAAIILAAGTAHTQEPQAQPEPKPQAETLPQPAYMSLPGYVDFDLATLLSAAEPAVIIQLEKPIIKMLAGTFAQEEPELAKLMEGLELVRVQVSPVPAENREVAIASVDSTVKNLIAAGEWTTMMRVQENQEQIHVLTRAAGDKMNGLAAFIMDPGAEAVFVNVVGEFSPEAIGALMSKAMSGHGPFMDFGDMDWEEMTKEHAGEDDDAEADDALGNTIAINAAGEVRYNGRVVDESELRTALQKLAGGDAGSLLVISASDEVAFGRVNELMELAREIGGQKFTINFAEPE